jgi:hypothetical protein
MRIETINILALIAGIVAVVTFNVRARYFFASCEAQVQKYKFYRIRDDLIRLVAENKLREESFVFEFFYRAVDFFIRHTNQMNLRSLVRALREAQERGLDPASTKEVARVQRELAQESSEVREVIWNFYATVMETFIKNSFVIRAIAHHPDKLRAIEDLRYRLIRMFSTEQQAYRFYKAYKNAVSVTAHLGDQLLNT